MGAMRSSTPGESHRCFGDPLPGKSGSGRIKANGGGDPRCGPIEISRRFLICLHRVAEVPASKACQERSRRDNPE